MEFRKQQNPQFCHEEGDDDYEDDHSENGAFDSDSDSGLDCDSDTDPSYCTIEDTQRQLSDLSIKKKSKSRIGNGMDEGIEKVDEKSFEEVEKIIQAGGVEKLKVEQCKVYLRKNGLRLTGNKETLLRRIKEHQEILNGRGEEKYPVSSFVLNCKGDACTGDIVMFEQNVYEMFRIASRSANGPPLGTRIVVGRIVKESYGAAKQQHTFTIEVLWSKGEKPPPPLHPLLIKGRNLYRLKTLRQKWEDEGERQKVLLDKHSRGSLARSARETRIQDKEMRKSLRENKGLKKERNRNQPHLKPNQGIQPPNLCSSINSGKAAPLLPGPSMESRMMTAQTQNYGAYMNAAHLKPNQGIQPLNLCSSVNSGKPAPQQSGPFMGSGIMTSRTQNYGQNMNSEKQTMEALKPANHRPVNMNRGTILENGFAERHHHRPPLTSMNYSRPIVPPNRQGCNQGKTCKFYAQGRCFYGDNCKFPHN